MTQTQLIDQLKDRLTQNTGEVLQQLKLIFKDNSESKNEVFLHAATYDRLLRDLRKERITYAEHNQGISKINDSLLQLIDTISKEEAEAYELENAIFKRILVICQGEKRIAAMRELFSDRYYKDVRFALFKEIKSVEEVNNYQLIIFDDMETNEAYYELYKYYLENAEPFLLYFGKRRVPDTNSKGILKGYFANSIFSIHARLQEMFLFLKYSKASGKK